MLNGEFHGKGKFVFGKKGGWYEGHYRLGRQVWYSLEQMLTQYSPEGD